LYFILCLAGITFAGTASSFGESVALGYLKHGFPPELVNAWSSGTGMAGACGSGIYLLLQAVSLADQYTFMLLIPLTFVYVGMHYIVIRSPPKATSTEKSPLLHGGSQEYTVNAETSETINGEPQKTRVETKGQRVWRCIKLSMYHVFQLYLVYMFEYVASTGAADRSQDVDFNCSPNWFIRNSYVILGFCYQIGVLISRSSLFLIKIKRVEILTILQGANMVFWILLAKYKFMEGDIWVWVQFILMLYCGLLGGAMYVNVFYIVLHDEKYPNEDRELCVNITAFAQTLGIASASVLDIIFSKYVWPDPIACSSSALSMSLSGSSSGSASTAPLMFLMAIASMWCIEQAHGLII